MLILTPPPRQISLETERLGPRRVDGLRKEDEEWQKKAHAAVLSIQDLTVKFFETTTRAQKGKQAVSCAFVSAVTFDPLCRVFIPLNKLTLSSHTTVAPPTGTAPRLHKYFNPQTIPAMHRNMAAMLFSVCQSITPVVMDTISVKNIDLALS